jgi:hypothetical protein
MHYGRCGVWYEFYVVRDGRGIVYHVVVGNVRVVRRARGTGSCRVCGLLLQCSPDWAGSPIGTWHRLSDCVWICIWLRTSANVGTRCVKGDRWVLAQPTSVDANADSCGHAALLAGNSTATNRPAFMLHFRQSSIDQRARWCAPRGEQVRNVWSNIDCWHLNTAATVVGTIQTAAPPTPTAAAEFAMKCWKNNFYSLCRQTPYTQEYSTTSSNS